MECRKNICYYFQDKEKNNLKLKKDYSKIGQATGIEIQCQRWVGNSKLSMERISVEYFSITYELLIKKENLN